MSKVSLNSADESSDTNDKETVDTIVATLSFLLVFSLGEQMPSIDFNEPK